VNPADLPEGASPRNWDVDYIVGSVFTRPGLANVFTFTDSLTITGYSIYAGVITLQYTSTKQPTLNEGFLLSGFTGQTSYLNGQTIFVDEFDSTTIQAEISHADDGPFSGLNGTAASTTGAFAGPNLGGQANVVASDGNVWTNKDGILGNTTYATATTGQDSTATPTPGTITNQSGTAWSNPANLISGSVFTTVSLSGASLSAPLLAHNTALAVPSNASVVGIRTSFQASTTAAAGKGRVLVQLATNGNGIGTQQIVPLGSSPTVFVQGSSSFQWGTTLTPDIVNGSAFGILLQAELLSGTGVFSANTFTVEVFYTIASSSEKLNVVVFNFTIPGSSGLSGFAANFQAFSTAATTISMQLLKNGIAIGTPRVQVLTTTPTVYTLGGANDPWDDTWTADDVNSTEFGVQIVASGDGTTSVRDLDVLAYITPNLVNFNYVKSFKQNSDQQWTLALDASGILWKENVTQNPDTLVVALTGILPGSYAQSSTFNDQEFIMFSDLTVGTERPRSYNGEQFFPVSQVGPGASISVVSSVGTSGNTLTLTDYEITSNVVTFTYTGDEPTPGQLYTVTGASPSYLNFTGEVLSVPAPTPTQFSMELTHGDVVSTPITPAATATLTYSYAISSITQPAANPSGDPSWGFVLWSQGPGSTAPGTVVTVYYRFNSTSNTPPVGAADPVLVNAFNSGTPVYVYITGNQFKGTYLVTSIGDGIAPGDDHHHVYFTFNYGATGYFFQEHGPGAYQMTLATVTVSTPIPNLSQGDTVQISDVTPGAWDSTWPVVSSLKSGVLNIIGTTMDNSGVATYQFNVQSGLAPTANEIVSITNCTNNAIFNTIGVIAGVSGSNFTISGFPGGNPIPHAFEAQGLGQTFGNQFTIDPGPLTVGTGTSPIYGNASAGGFAATVGGSVTPIGAGTRQAVCYFITESGYETAPGPPIIFTTSSDANFINVSNIPIGPPNVVARVIAFTEAGQNGVPGANFYVIPDPVRITVGNQTVTYTSTFIKDNTTTTAQFSFTDAVLLNSTEIDVQGNNLFNLVEIGSSAWCLPYASRMFYGLQLNKVQNFVNLSFDGGYLPNSGSSKLPLGWNVNDNSNTNIDLAVSSVTGNSLYLSNNTGATIATAGLLSQSAYLDAYQVAIIRPNTLYSVRVAARCPSGVQLGTLVVSLVDFNPGIGYGTVYGSFSVPLSDMSTTTEVFSGALLITPFVDTVSKQLTLTLQIDDFGDGADCEIDRVEPYPTSEPYLKTQVYGSYLTKPEAVDASGEGGIIDTTNENAQPCVGGFVLHDNLYLLKTESLYSTQDDPNSEPSGWGLHEVSNRVGAVGIHAYDYGEEWAVMACRSGIFGFNGGQPAKMMQELWNLWELINWTYGHTIVLRNDIVNRRILCAVPLPTPNKWLPFDPQNPNPTSPNVMLMLNYQGLNTFEELVNSPAVHTTMFGTLAAVDMKRKWSIWRIPTPYMDFIRRHGTSTKPLFVCNGIDSSRIYQFLDDQLSDDGVEINGLYTTYGFVDAVKATTIPIFGFHAKRYTVLQVTSQGAGVERIRAYPNTLDNPRPIEILGSTVVTQPGAITLKNPAYDDWFRPMNVRGNRVYMEFSTNAVGHWFELSKVMLSGQADHWATLNPTGGGNAGHQ
jgi:hypothetical protein